MSRLTPGGALGEANRASSRSDHGLAAGFPRAISGNERATMAEQLLPV